MKHPKRTKSVFAVLCTILFFMFSVPYSAVNMIDAAEDFAMSQSNASNSLEAGKFSGGGMTETLWRLASPGK